MNVLRSVSAFILRIFFRGVSVAGLEHVPRDAPVIFAPNHQNALVDPLFLFAFAPRRIAFLAKEPLFRMPLVGWLVRAAGAIPVYRRQDNADMARNREMFARVQALLARGGAVALFPEGLSHGDAHLHPFKTGAARMALGATAVAPSDRPVSIIPTGLYYTASATFRSAALVYFGAPLVVPRIVLTADGEPSPNDVRLLTARLTDALADVTLQAEQHDALALITRAERIFSSGDETGRRQPLVNRFEMRRRFLAGYVALRERAPARLARAEAMIARHEARLAAAGLSPENVAAGRVDQTRLIRSALHTVPVLVVMLPIALVGIVIHFPAYRVVGPIATGMAHGPDVIATNKIAVAAFAFPVTWALVAVLIGERFGAVWGALAFVAAPCTGWIALRFLERLNRVIGGSRAMALLLSRPMAFRRLLAERRRIREEIMALATEQEQASAPASGSAEPQPLTGG
ncbi:MAG: 1-acyl-sn-glycerol-3-phosphate acyltransferase [Gemmatimonadaceae bacterium]